MSSADEPQRYVPAAGRAGLTRLYDPIMALTMRESDWRGRLIDEVLAGAVVSDIADVGCGTGTTAIALARRAPWATVTGVDGDREILSIAGAKAAAAGAEVQWRGALATALPFGDRSVDRVVSSLLLHHLVHDQKVTALAEFHRILRPGGRAVIADWGRGADPLTRAAFLTLRILDGRANTADHASGALPEMIAQAGFSPVRRTARLRTIWGSLEILVAERRA